MAHILERMAAVLENMTQDREAEPAEYRGLNTFKRNNPPSFNGGYDPEGAQTWIAKTEKVFTAMNCLPAHKVVFATYMLDGEAEDWWKFTKQTMPTIDDVIPWETFRARFLEKYFPEDIRQRKAREFLDL